MSDSQSVNPGSSGPGVGFEAQQGAVKAGQSKVLKVGIDLGTNSTVVAGSRDGERLAVRKDIFSTVVGFPKEGILPGILPSGAEALFGEEALSYRLHLDLKWPLKDGFVDDVEVCKLFTRHVRLSIDPSGELQFWGVVGVPANASPERQKEMRSALIGVLDRLLVVPEPFLAAMGLREDENFKRAGPAGDPTKHSLIVDIGAGTTDLCLVRGYFPTAEDQVSFAKAGDYVDEAINQGVRQRYPDLKLTRVTVTRIKEENAFVSDRPRQAVVKVYVDGRPKQLDFSDIIQGACEQLIPLIVNGIRELFKRCDSDSVVDIMQNIIISGGGSQIQGLCEAVQRRLREEGFDQARTVAPQDYKRLVAKGALAVAENARENQWQVPM